MENASVFVNSHESDLSNTARMQKMQVIRPKGNKIGDRSFDNFG